MCFRSSLEDLVLKQRPELVLSPKTRYLFDLLCFHYQLHNHTATTNSNIAQSLRQKLNSGYQIYNVFVNSCFAFPCLCFILFLGFLCVATLLVSSRD